jgi:toxin ParE1/3/4
VRLSREAEDDLTDIVQYTADTWGQEQAVAYKAKLDQALRNLVDFPALGRARDDLPSGYRSLRVEQHVIYYRIEGRAIRVNRILHVRRDAKREVLERRAEEL